MSELAYLNLLQQLVNKADGDVRQDRTGTGTYSIFGHQMRFDLSKGFPLLTTKKIHAHSVVHELLWFLKGDTNIKYLLENNVHIWTEWRYKAYLKDFNDLAKILEPEDTPFTQEEFEQEILNDPKFAEDYGNIGKGYGHQWRNFGEVQLNDCDTDLSEFMNNDAEDGTDVVKTGLDQISWVINEIKTNPTSRRLIVTGWNPQEVDQVDLPPCHTLFQFFVEDGKLSCQLYQRSADVFLGVPFNIASYALLTHMIAQVCGLAVGEFVWTGGDTHLYANHVEQAKLQLSRKAYEFPKLELNPHKNIEDYQISDVHLVDYIHHDAIKAPVAV